MTEYLEKAALVRILRAKAEMGRLSEYSVCFDNVAKMIELLPAADVAEVKHGKWIGHLFSWSHEEIYPILEKSDYLECSICKENHYINTYDFFSILHECRPSYDKPDLIPKYCPSCGAKMDLEG